MTTTTRQALVDAEVTLDGQRAVVTGIRHDFATIRSLEDPARSAEWAWGAVERIVSKGGAFYS